VYKIEKIKHLLDCDIYNKLLIDPVSTLCGFIVCKSHLDHYEDTFQCDLCNSEHTVPKNRYKVLKRLQDALSIQLNTFELTPVYDECKKIIEEAQKDVNEIESIDKDPENFIYEYFEDIKRQVDLRREYLKEKIDTYSDETIESINNAQINCQKLAKEVNKLSKDFEDSKINLNEQIKEFDTFKISEQKFQMIKENVSVLTSKLNEILTQFKSSLINDKVYDFRFEDVPISNVFGKFEEVIIIFNSC
jgi:DNA repair ATPase RecN